MKSLSTLMAGVLLLGCAMTSEASAFFGCGCSCECGPKRPIVMTEQGGPCFSGNRGGGYVNRQDGPLFRRCGRGGCCGR